jgi:MFS family permease
VVGHCSQWAAIGVLAGGVLTDVLDWRWVLFVNVPVGIALLAAAFWALPESRARGASRRLDLHGAALLTAAMTLLVYGIVGTDTHPWGSMRTLSVLALGVVLLATRAQWRRDLSPQSTSCQHTRAPDWHIDWRLDRQFNPPTAIQRTEGAK